MENMKTMGEIIAAKFNQHIASSTTEPQYNCPECRDSGWKVVDPVTNTVIRCACVRAKEAEEQMRNSGLAEVLETYTFEKFDTDRTIQADLKALAHKYMDDLYNVKDFPRHPWLFVCGNPGGGKSHICSAVCGELLKRRVAVKYAKWLEVSQKLKASVNDEDFDELISEYVNARVLYVDDLFKQRYTKEPVFTDSDIKIAFSILNERYTRNKPTIISTEWELIDQLLPADEGLFSRVYERCKRHMITIERKPENNYRLWH